MNRKSGFVFLAMVGSLWASTTGGTGHSSVQVAPAAPQKALGSIKLSPHTAKPAAPKKARRSKSGKVVGAGKAPKQQSVRAQALPPHSLLSSAMSMSGGTGHTVVMSLPPLPYQNQVGQSGTSYVAPWGMDTGGCGGIANPCQHMDHVNPTGPAVVFLRGGIYYPPSGATSTAVNIPGGGSSSATQIVYAAYPGETPIVTGALPITGWQPANGTAQCATGTILTCFMAVLPANITSNFEYLMYAPGGWPTSYLPYLIGRRTQSLSTPTGYSFNADNTCTGISGPPTAYNCMDVNSQDIMVLCGGSLSGCSGTPPPYPHHPTDIKLYNFDLSSADVFRINSVNNAHPPCGTGGTPCITFSGTPFLGMMSGGRYLIVNSREYFMSNATPGTFYLDCGTACTSSVSGATIYYIAKSGENPPTDLILAPQTTSIVTDTPPSPGLSAGYGFITFEGLTFMGDNYTVPILAGTVGGYSGVLGQPNVTAALSFVDTNSVTIDSSIIAHTSGWGVEFTNDYCFIPGGTGCPAVGGQSTANQLTNSAIFDIGTSGIRVGRYPNDSTDSSGSVTYATQNTSVYNNIFSGMGRMYPGGEDGCVWIGSAHDNSITYNECADSYGGGIAVGPGVGSSTGGITSDFVYNNTATNNNFHDLGEGVISDFGCVHFANYGGIEYLLNHSLTLTGNTFNNNICHDITHATNDAPGPGGPPNGGTGLYIDNNSQLNSASYNLIYRTSGALYFNNISPNCNTSGGTTACLNTVSNNILAYSAQGPVKRGGDVSDNGDKFNDLTFNTNVVFFDVGNGPQWVNDVGGAWNCDNSVNYPFPCTKLFTFLSNDYWSPSVNTPSFWRIVGSTPTIQSFSQWTSSPVLEDNDPTHPTIYANPGFLGAGFPVDNYRFRDTTSAGVPGKIGFDFSKFESTYSAGRKVPIIFPPVTTPGFPVQLLPVVAF